MAKKTISVGTINSLEELKDEVNYEDFEFKNYFKHICNLIPNVAQEKLDLMEIDSAGCRRAGVVYVFVIDGKIFKVGESINNIKDRVQSYNCGKLEYRLKGTCSTTNFFVLQSLLKINEPVYVYAYFPNEPEYEIFGKKFKNSRPPSKTAEALIIQDFIDRYEKKPIGCTQR